MLTRVFSLLTLSLALITTAVAQAPNPSQTLNPSGEGLLLTDLAEALLGAMPLTPRPTVLRRQRFRSV
jgi:hypothetical protein